MVQKLNKQHARLASSWKERPSVHQSSTPNFPSELRRREDREGLIDFWYIQVSTGETLSNSWVSFGKASCAGQLVQKKWVLDLVQKDSLGVGLLNGLGAA